MTKTSSVEHGQDFPDMARKIEHLKGIMAPLVSDDTFTDKCLAGLCGCTIHTFSRKKNGTTDFKPGELGLLIHAFRLGPGFTYADFQLEFETFDQKLRDQQVGAYAPDPRADLAQLLDSISDPHDPIVIKTVANRQIGGIGGDPSLAPHPVLMNGQHVRLVVPLPAHAKGGHLIVLNYSPEANGGISLLMPSRFAPDTDVLPYPLTLPTDASLYPSFPVSTPEGARPIFALWCADAPSHFLDLPQDAENTVASLPPIAISQLCVALRADADRPEGRKFIAFKGQYDVRDASAAAKHLRR